MQSGDERTIPHLYGPQFAQSTRSLTQIHFCYLFLLSFNFLSTFFQFGSSLSWKCLFCRRTRTPIEHIELVWAWSWRIWLLNSSPSSLLLQTLFSIQPEATIVRHPLKLSFSLRLGLKLAWWLITFELRLDTKTSWKTFSGAENCKTVIQLCVTGKTIIE